jgi:hypothetical protein
MPPATPSGGATPNPGPFEPDADESWRQYCEATDNSDMRSGVETATEQDLSVFRDPICPTGSPNNSAGNCISLPALRANELEAVTESPDPAGGCGRFEQPGPDGTCGTASRIEMLGRVAWIGQADLGEVLICDPLVCRPPGQ